MGVGSITEIDMKRIKLQEQIIDILDETPSAHWLIAKRIVKFIQNNYRRRKKA